MNKFIITDDEIRLKNYPISTILCFPLIHIWKIGVALFLSTNFPFETTPSSYALIVFFVIGSVLSFLITYNFPNRIIHIERTIIIIGLISMIALFFPLPNKFRSILLFIHGFCAVLMPGIETSTATNLFSEKNTVRYLTLTSGSALLFIAIIHKQLLAITFSVFQVSTIVILIVLLFALFHTPNNKPIYIRNSETEIDLSLQKGIMIGMFPLAFVGPFIGLSSPIIAWRVPNGFFITYVTAAITFFLIYYLYTRLKIHPFYFITICIGSGCIGFLFTSIAYFFPTLKYVACVFIGFGLIPCLLFPLCLEAMMNFYPSRMLASLSSELYLLASLTQYILIVNCSDNHALYNFVNTSCACILVIIYLQLGSPMLYKMIKHKKKAIHCTEEQKHNVQNQTSFLSDKLSKRELEVVTLIAQGLNNHEIAQELFISIYTVNDHTKNIYRKLDVHSRYELIALLNQNK